MEKLKCESSMPRPFVDVILAMHDLIDKCKDDEEFKGIIDEFREFVSRLALYFYGKTNSKTFIEEERNHGGDDR